MKSLLLNANGNIDFSPFFFNQKVLIYLPISVLSSAVLSVSVVAGKCQTKVTKWVSGQLQKQREDLTNGTGLLSQWTPSLLISINSPQEPGRGRC